MEKEAFISSGLIELYVLGALSSEDQSLVESMLVKFPELNSEVVAAEKELMKYAELHAPKLPAHIKGNILSAISTDQKTVSQVADNTKPPSLSYWLAAASILLLVISGIFNYLQYQSLKSAKQQIASLNEEKEVLAQNMNNYKTSFEVAEQKITILNDTAVRTIPMKGMKISPNSLALIHWNKQTKETYLDIASLPKPPAAMQYQLWAIVDGKAVDLGVFDITKNDYSLHRMKNVSQPQAFAVTLEKQGGSPTPTMENMYVLGSV